MVFEVLGGEGREGLCSVLLICLGLGWERGRGLEGREEQCGSREVTKKVSHMAPLLAFPPKLTKQLRKIGTLKLKWPILELNY